MSQRAVEASGGRLIEYVKEMRKEHKSAICSKVLDAVERDPATIAAVGSKYLNFNTAFWIARVAAIIADVRVNPDVPFIDELVTDLSAIDLIP